MVRRCFYQRFLWSAGTPYTECGPRISSGEESVTMTRGNFVIRCNDRGFVHGMGGMRGQLGN